MSARIVIEKIIRIPKIKRLPLKDWNSRSIVNFAGSTHPIRKQNKEKLGVRELVRYAIEQEYFSPSWAGEDSINRPVALIGRASDSKSEGWGFESLLACIKFAEGYVFKGNRVSG